jgi:glycine/D-amino acid oxidase-like deaminating enzyme
MSNLKKNEFDLLIIGGGVAGVSCGYWLTKLHDFKVGIIDSESIQNWNLSQEMSNLSVGSVKHLFNIYKKYGVEKVIKNYEYMLSNLELISTELNIFETNSYVDLYNGGTINKIVKNFNCEFNANTIEEFLLSIAEKIDDIEVINSDEENISLKLTHDGTYDLKKFFNQILNVIKSEIEIIESTTCTGLRKSGENIIVNTNNGDYTAKKIIFSNGNGLDLSLPELKDKLKMEDGFVFECNAGSVEVDESNYIDINNNNYYYRNKNKIFYGVQDQDITQEAANDIFNTFIDEKFPEASDSKSIKTKVAYSNEAFPLCGQSTMNTNLYYLGGFSGQSKKYAFKMARDLVQRIKI